MVRCVVLREHVGVVLVTAIWPSGFLLEIGRTPSHLVAGYLPRVHAFYLHPNCGVGVSAILPRVDHAVPLIDRYDAFSSSALGGDTRWRAG